LSQPAWDARFSLLNDALHLDCGSSALDILQRVHPVGQMYSRGEISESEFLSAMAYFVATVTAPRFDELHADLAKLTGLDFSPMGLQSIRGRAWDEFSLLENLEIDSDHHFDLQWKIRRARDVSQTAIINLKPPDSPSDDADFRWGLKLLAVSLGMRI
jgi:hypothetical protein